MLRFFLLLTVTAPSSQSPCLDTAAVVELVNAQRSRYPVMGITDVLKLLQQATMGSEHWVTTRADAQHWMDDEWHAVTANTLDPLIDTLGTHGSFARIYLGPYRAAGGKPAALLDAFIETGRVHGDTATLSCSVRSLITLTGRRELPWSPDSVIAAAAAWERTGYAALDHTSAYERTYHPHYRVVSVALVPALLRTLASGHRPRHLPTEPRARTNRGSPRRRGTAFNVTDGARTRSPHDQEVICIHESSHRSAP